MDKITIEVTPDQRLIILQALAHWVSERQNKYDIGEVREVYNIVGATKCGDRYCRYCGDLKYNVKD